MYSVPERILQTDKGKVIVRSHDVDRNAQSIYAELLQVMTQSTEAMMDSGELLSYLTTAKIERLIFVALITTRSLPFLLSLLGLWRDLNGEMSFL
jgi:hypothetical protein